MQQNFKKNLDEYLSKRRRQRFDPQTYKRDGFLTKRAATLFNGIADPDPSGVARQELIFSFVTECNINAQRTTRSKRSSPVPEDGAQQTQQAQQKSDGAGSGNILALPF